MKKISFLFCLLTLVSSVFAAEGDKFYYQCHYDTFDNRYCYVNYGSSKAAIDEPDVYFDNRVEEDSSDSWNDVVAFFNTKKEATSFHIKLLSNIDLGGLDENKVNCKAKVDPFSIENDNFYFRGNNHTIKNFCLQNQWSSAFFHNARSYAQFHDVVFDSAYVVVNDEDGLGSTMKAAVLVDSLVHGTINNVTIKNSKVLLKNISTEYLTYYLGGVAGIAENVQFENINVENVSIGVLNFSSGNDGGRDVFAGGIVGSAAFDESNSFTNNKVAAQIKIPFSSSVHAGGLAGRFSLGKPPSVFVQRNLIKPNTAITVDDADSQNIIELSAEKIGVAQVGGLFGYLQGVGIDADKFIFQNNSVVGGLAVAAKAWDFNIENLVAEKMSAVGGLVGLFHDDGNAGFSLKGNSSVGSIKTDPSAYTGYLIGSAYAKNPTFKMHANYHYGKNDGNVELPIKFCGTGPENEILALLESGKSYYNYRNTVKSGDEYVLESSGVLNYLGYAVGSDGKQYGNAVLNDSAWNSRELAYVMNVYGSDAPNNVYWESDTLNNGLPYMTDVRTAFKVSLDVTAFGTSEESAKNTMVEGSTNLKDYYDDLDSKRKIFMVLTDRDGHVPQGFVDAYKKDIVEKGYSLLLDRSGSSLSVARTYGFKVSDPSGGSPVAPDEYLYKVVKGVEFKVSYYRQVEGDDSPEYVDITDGPEYVFSPQKVNEVDLYEDSKVIPRIYFKESKESGGVWLTLENVRITCRDISGDDRTFEDFTIETGNLSFSRLLYGIAADVDLCVTTPELHLIYNEEDYYSGSRIFVAKNNDFVGMNVSMYGYSGDKIKLYDLGSFDGSYKSEFTLVSQYKFEVYRGYEEIKPMDIDVWYIDRSLYNSSIDKCLDTLGFRVLERCLDSLNIRTLNVGSAPSYLDSSNKIRGAMDRYNAIRWNLNLDSTRIFSVDSLIVGLFKDGQANLSDIMIVVRPKPNVNVVMYKVAFMLENISEIAGKDELILPEGDPYVWGDTLDFCVNYPACKTGEFPKDVYRNESCVVGWKSKDMRTNDSTLKFGLRERFNIDLFEEALDPGVSLLYPVWAPAGYCAEEKISVEDSVKWFGAHVEGSFTRTVFDAVGGDIQIVDVKLGDSTIRNLGTSKSMLLPSMRYAGDGGIRILNFEAKDGFVAPDTMFFYYDLTRMPKENGKEPVVVSSLKPFLAKTIPSGVKNVQKFVSGDTLPDDLAYSVLWGDFKMVNTTPLAFVDSAVIPSGYAVRLKVSTTEFAAGRDAKLTIAFMDNLGNDINAPKKIETTIESTPFVLDTTYFLRPGSYIVRGVMRDALDSVATFTYRFKVSSEIPAGKDQWIMVNLKSIDMKNVGKDDDQIFYWWNDNADAGEFWRYIRFIPGEDLTANRGYWYSSLEGRPLKVDSSYVDSVYDVVWNLVNGYDGWNLVSNPHSWDIAVPDSLDMSCWDERISNYTDCENVLGGFRAAWVHVEKSDTVTLSGKPVFATGANHKKRTLAKAKNAENWTINAVLADGRGHQDSWNVLGMGEELEGYEPPAGMGDQVNFSIKNGKKFLAKSVKVAPASSKDSLDFEWDVVLSASSDRKGKLFFEGLDGIAAFGYHLYVTMDGKTSELMAGDTLQVALKAKGTSAKVRVTTEKLYLVTAVNGLRMAQAGNKLNVGFTATENLAGARMVVDVLGMDGKVISSHAARAAAGANAVTLDAPKPGLYMLRVRVASRQASRKILVK